MADISQQLYLKWNSYTDASVWAFLSLGCMDSLGLSLQSAAEVGIKTWSVDPQGAALLHYIQ